MAQFLGPAAIREIAAGLDLRPTKSLGQNFLHDANTIRKIVRVAGLDADDVVLEVGPGLGSLTLGLLDIGARVVAVEIDSRLAQALPATVARLAPEAGHRLAVLNADALQLRSLPEVPTALVANLPYNISVPVLLTLLERFPGLEHGLVLVQAEVAERLAAEPGSPAYGVPSVKAAWYAEVRRAGPISRQVFWPVPRVDSSLVSFRRRPSPDLAAREDVFAVIDAAFASRRKGLRAALSGWAGSAAAAETILRAADIDPLTRGEQLGVEDFTRIAWAGAAT
ncbi:MAG: 16S rRNA (adenine(1518)-N(6)/adenine(1519)-N(6))-dimethyltransferase RsmA [Geodermatophilaceae bacterium]|nr:16S rRNA (adenine(1518)-N(6)/adenine(1519)-N(6))-dimethyltransferase RsmA [Geodermatophilaceae bacterium]